MEEKLSFKLEVFDGPLDLLLHLLQKNKVEILDIPIAEILKQFLEYVDQYRYMDLDSLSEFIAMASHLTYIKSKMLLPRHSEEEPDPRAELVETLLDYQRFKMLGAYLTDRAQIGQNIFVKGPEPLEGDGRAREISGTPSELARAFRSIFERFERRLPPPVAAFAPIIETSGVTVGERLNALVALLLKKRSVRFESLIAHARSRAELVADFMAVLELLRMGRVTISGQMDDFVMRIAGE